MAEDKPLPEDPGGELMRLLVGEMLRRLQDKERAAILSASELEVIRKLLTDNSVTLAHVRRGDFGELAKEAAESFPFDEGGEPRFQ